MKKPLLSLSLILFAFLAVSQDKNAVKYAKTIRVKDLKKHLNILASDSLEGRETGERGQKIAAEYIAAHFQSLGLKGPVAEGENPYFQSYPLNKMVHRTSYFKKGKDKKKNFKDFVYFSKSETYGEEIIHAQYVGTEITDTLVNELRGKYLVVSREKVSSWRTTLADLEEKGIAGTILIVEDENEFDFIRDRFSAKSKKPQMSLGKSQVGGKVIIGNPALAEWIFDKTYSQIKGSEEGLKAKLIFNADMLVENIYAENVLGFLKGTEKPEEVLVISSHYDHIGITDGKINNGADDDGSGTSAVLEIAEAFIQAARDGHKPKRSILFMTVSGEEKGLLGSEYYSENPVFPIENTVTDLNVDMIGRIDPGHESKPNYIYLIGSDRLSTELHNISEKVNGTYANLELDYTYNDENDPNRFYYRSDHYNFAKYGIPIIFYFNGTHADYHKPTDTVDKIEFKLMEKRSRLIFHTAWELANRDDRVVVDKEIK